MLQRLAATFAALGGPDAEAEAPGVIGPAHARLRAEAEALAEVLEHVDRTLADEAGRWVLAAHPEGTTEWTLTALDEAGELRQLVLDRRFRDAETGEHWIVDYKTSRPLPGEPREAFEAREAEAHRAQLAAYREALAAIVGGPVRSALYFTALGQLLRFP